MRRFGKLNRRSFLARVAGGAAIAGGTLATPALGQDPNYPGLSEAGARARRARTARAGITDSDIGPRADRGGCARGPRPVTGLTDTDSGATADPPRQGLGRGPTRRRLPACRNPIR